MAVYRILKVDTNGDVIGQKSFMFGSDTEALALAQKAVAGSDRAEVWLDGRLVGQTPLAAAIKA